MRHNKVCAHLHYSIFKTLGNETTDKWYTHTHTHTHMPKLPVHEQKVITVLWNQAVHTDTEFIAKRPDIAIKKKRENMHTHGCGNTHRQKCLAQGRGKEAKIHNFMYRNTTNG
jgi:hypothetical protein